MKMTFRASSQFYNTIFARITPCSPDHSYLFGRMLRRIQCRKIDFIRLDNNLHVRCTINPQVCRNLLKVKPISKDSQHVFSDLLERNISTFFLNIDHFDTIIAKINPNYSVIAPDC